MGQKWPVARSQRAGAPISLRQWCTISAQATKRAHSEPTLFIQHTCIYLGENNDLILEIVWFIPKDQILAV
jgi:hypothetical protein